MAPRTAPPPPPRRRPWAVLYVVLLMVVTVVVVLAVNNATGDVSGKDGVMAGLGVVVVGIAALLVVQTITTGRRRRADIARARALDQAPRRDLARLSDAGAMPEDELRRALAVTGDGDETKATEGMWDIASRSQRSGVIITVMILVLMPIGVVLGDPKVLAVLAVPIILYAVWLAVNTLRPGGVLTQAYASADEGLAPLGLRTTGKPRWVVIPYADGTMHATVVGPTVVGGVRHGRAVEVAFAGGRAQVAVASPAPAFTITGKDGVLLPGDGAPPWVAGLVGPMAPASVWDGLQVQAGDGRILTERRFAGAERWAHDLWLAERLADAASR